MTPAKRSRTVAVAVITGVLIVIAAVLGVGWWYIDRTATTWEGDRTFRVTTLPDPQDPSDTYRVESTDETPDGGQVGSGASVTGSIDRDDMPAGVQLGDTVVCHTKETYRINTDIANGSHWHVLDCRR